MTIHSKLNQRKKSKEKSIFLKIFVLNFPGKTIGEKKTLLQISCSLRPVFLVTGQESRRRSQKGSGEVFPVPSSLPPQKDAVAEGPPGGNGGSPHREKRNHHLFWRGDCLFTRAGDQLASGNGLYWQKTMKIKTFQVPTQ